MYVDDVLRLIHADTSNLVRDFPFSDGLHSVNHPRISLCHKVGKILANSNDPEEGGHFCVFILAGLLNRYFAADVMA